MAIYLYISLVGVKARSYIFSFKIENPSLSHFIVNFLIYQ
jgi:hypothetical protein